MHRNTLETILGAIVLLAAAGFMTLAYEVAVVDGNGGYGVLHFRGDGAGSTNTRFTMGVGDDKFYMAYDDVDNRHNIIVNGDGHVGIGGISSPDQALQVKGVIETQATNSTNGWMLYTHTDNTFRVNYNGSGADEITVDTSGNATFTSSVKAVNLKVYSGSTEGPRLTYGNNERNLYLQPPSGSDAGLSLFNGSGNHLMQLYGFNDGSGTIQYGFLDANWASWDMQKVPSGHFRVDEGSGLKRVLNEGNYATQISSLNDVQFTGLYVGSTNTSYDFYTLNKRNNTSFFFILFYILINRYTNY